MANPAAAPGVLVAVLVACAAVEARAEPHPFVRHAAPLASMVALNLTPQAPKLRLPDPVGRLSQAPPERPRALAPLYVSFVALQAMDADSTIRSVRAGRVEANPLLRPAAGNAAMMLTVKAASTAGTIYAVEKLWKRNRTAAVIVMVAVNVGYAAIVSSNYARLREGR